MIQKKKKQEADKATSGLSSQKVLLNPAVMPSQSSITNTVAQPTPPMGLTSSNVTDFDSYPTVPTVIANQIPSSEPTRSQNPPQYDLQTPPYISQSTILPSAPPPEYSPPSYDVVMPDNSQIPKIPPNLPITEDTRIIPTVDRSSKPFSTPISYTPITPFINRDSKPTDILSSQGIIINILFY